MLLIFFGIELDINRATLILTFYGSVDVILNESRNRNYAFTFLVESGVVFTGLWPNNPPTTNLLLVVFGLYFRRCISYKLLLI